MRMHHSGRILHTTAIYAFPEEIDIPLIPYKVLENKKRPPAASTVLGGTPTQEATGGQSFT
jgi:hypothetical protein